MSGGLWMTFRLRTALAAASLAGAAALSGCAVPAASQWQDLCTPEAVTAKVAAELRRTGEYERAMRYLSRSCPQAALALSDIPTESISAGSAGDTDGGSSIFGRDRLGRRYRWRAFDPRPGDRLVSHVGVAGRDRYGRRSRSERRCHALRPCSRGERDHAAGGPGGREGRSADGSAGCSG